MNIGIIGTGYVGLVTGACFAEFGHNVICVDKDSIKIEKLNTGIIPIYEPGLEALVKKNAVEGRLKFTTNLPEAVKESLFVFIAVGTPPGEDGMADLSQVLNVAREIANSINDYKVIVNKSTVPVGTAAKVREIIAYELAQRWSFPIRIEFDIVSNPEFLKEGSAIEDFMRPDRVVIGVNNARAAKLMKELYNPFLRSGHPVLLMDTVSSELTKYAANAMLATRISFMNEIAAVCERAAADVEQVRLGIGSDARIGKSFLYAGIGYGGSCFPKDVRALIKTAEQFDVHMEILRAVEYQNSQQKIKLAQMVVERFGSDLSKYRFAVWGLAFKPNTDDMREAPSVEIVNELCGRGAILQVHDPIALPVAKQMITHKNVVFCDNQYTALENVNALLLVTEWSNYRAPDFEKCVQYMKQNIIFDGRNQYDPETMARLGYEYYCIGRATSNAEESVKAVYQVAASLTGESRELNIK